MHPVPVAQHPLRAWLHATLPQVLLAHVLSLAGGECGHSQGLARAAPALAVGVERRPGQLVKLVFVHCLLCCLGVTSRQSLVVAQRPRLFRLPVRPVISNTQGLRYKACGAIPRSTGDAPGRAGLWAQSASRHSRASARAARGLSGARPYRGSADAPEGGLQAVRLSRAIGASSKGGHEHIQKKYASLDTKNRQTAGQNPPNSAAAAVAAAAQQPRRARSGCAELRLRYVACRNLGHAPALRVAG